MARPRGDIDIALALFRGISQPGPIGKTVYPSAKTSPTEKEACAAMSRLLLQAAAKFLLPASDNSGLGSVLFALAAVISPNEATRRRVVFKNSKQGRGDSGRDYDIAALVDRLSKAKGMKRAIGEVAEMANLGTRTVERIYAKNKADIF